ncbi:AraC family transcriptional regulator [Marinilabilia salmonicolor]|jgi:AraC-like DNA-binding protein|uniref:AraC-like DNA-binding protein n=1 Tax=Marinilabilia salmonicolor TaxID=989 RepID=A0A368UNK2_9BACT|nr:helix-turn-helix domain-containing protein [Marinilabilia salmonicolor]RCW30356.1 AraC-like DNA-binding protein [Marinilabilia salmonicolor]
MLQLVTIQFLLSALVFVFFKPGHPSNRLLALWYCINVLNFIGFIIPGDLTEIIGIGYLPFLFLNGPIFFFYIQSIIKIEFRFKWIHSLHLIPFVLFSLSRFLIYNESFAPSFYYGAQMPYRILLVYISISVSITGYLVAIFFMLIKHRKEIKNYFSFTSREITLDWFLIVITIISISYILLIFIPLFDFIPISPGKKVFWFNQFNLALLGFILLIFGLLQPVIYTDTPVNQEERRNSQKIKSGRSGLSSEEMTEISNTIMEYLTLQKPYLNPDYSLEQMARDLNITRQNISLVINESIGKNFFQLINEFRVEEFKQLVIDPKLSHITLLGLAFDAGFNSKSSFNRIFKEFSGETPSSFKRKLQN